MKKSKKNIFLTLLAILLLQTSFSQIEVMADRDSMLIGEELSVSIRYPVANSTSSLEFYEGDSIGNGFEVLEIKATDTINGKINHSFSVTNFEEGTHFIPPFTVFYGEKKWVSQPIPVFISLMEVDTNQPFKDLKPILEDPLTTSDYMKMAWNWIKKFWWIVLITFLLIGVLLWLIFKKKKPAVVKEIPKPSVPAHIIANKKLEQLEEKQLWQNGHQKEYNVELTAIIQAYISNRYQVPTAEKTSSEILHSLRFIEIGEQNKQNLKKLLTLSDLVKFAKEQPTAEDNESVLKEAYIFIETTKKIAH